MKNLENLTIEDYLNIVRRRIMYVIVTAILISAGAVVVVQSLPSIYKSETTILVSSGLLPEDYIRSIDRQTTSDQIDFVRQELQSRTFLEEIVREFHFASDSGSEDMESASNVIRGNTEITVLTANSFKIGFYSPYPRLAQAVTKRLAEKVIQLNGSSRREKVQVADQFLEQQWRQAADDLSQAEEKLFQYRSQTSPGIASEVVTADGLRDLELQLAKLQTTLDDASNLRDSLERRMEEHRQLQVVVKAVASPADAPTPTAPQASVSPRSPLEEQLANRRTELASASMRYTALHPEVVRLTQEVRELDAAVKEESAAAKSSAATAPSNEPKENSILPELNPVDLFAAEIQKELDEANREISQTQQSKNALLAKIGAYQERLNPSNAEPQLGSLTRAYDAAKQRYNYLSDKKLNAEMAARVDASNSNEMFKVIEAAYLPIKPVKPNRRLLAALGSLGGLVLGLGIAFLRDYAASALHDEAEAVSELKLPVLASIPSLPDMAKEKRKKRHNEIPLRVPAAREDLGSFSIRNADANIRDVLLNPASIAGEPYRLLHSILALTQKERSIKRLLISSAVPGEGKTFTSCCLAGTLAHERGKKVLLIDADLRRSRATSMLGLGSRKFANTFSALLRGDADIEKSAIHFEDLNLWFLPSGTMVSNPLETLSSPQLEGVLNHFSQIFDWVIVDSPPILAVADANLMLPLCDEMLMVISAGKTPVKLVKDSIQRISRDRICGVLMNRTKAIQSSYYYGYRGYYQVPSEAPTVLSGLKRHDAADSAREM